MSAIQCGNDGASATLVLRIPTDRLSSLLGFHSADDPPSADAAILGSAQQLVGRDVAIQGTARLHIVEAANWEGSGSQATFEMLELKSLRLLPEVQHA